MNNTAIKKIKNDGKNVTLEFLEVNTIYQMEPSKEMNKLF